MNLNNNLKISNVIKTSKENSIILLNDTYNNIVRLRIIKENTIIKESDLNNTDLNDLGLNDMNLIINLLSDYCTDKSEAYYILNKLIEDLNNNHENGYLNTENNLIIRLYDDNLRYIEASKKEKEIAISIKHIEDLKHDINVIINKIIDRDENPKLLTNQDLPKYLANYLNLKYGLILRSNVNTIHLLNENNQCYETTNFETLLKIVGEDFGYNNISMKQLNNAIDYITLRLKPKYNIIRFNNCIYDTDIMEVTELTSPQLPYYDIYFNYNPNAKGELIQEFLYSSLNQKQVKGLLELIGYLFTVGNKENIILCFIGKGGGGKSVLANIISYLFKKVSYLPIHNLNKNHELSILENKFINICNDTDNKPIEDNGTFKQLSGEDNILINPKYRTPYIMPSEEIPKFIIVGNHFPKFKKLEVPIIQRLILLEFKKSFRNTKQQKKDLYSDIIKNHDNIEWLIYNSLKAYNEMLLHDDEFILKRSYDDNLDLYNKHSNPLKWIIEELFIFDEDNLIIKDYGDYELNDNIYLSVDEVKQKIINYANIEGLDINEDNIITTKQLTNTIKSAFDLWSLKDNYGIDYKPIQKQRNYNRFYVYENFKLKD